MVRISFSRNVLFLRAAPNIPLNSFYLNAKDEEEKEFLVRHSPTAWVHLNLLGYYQFRNSADRESYEILIDQWISKCNWRKTPNLPTTLSPKTKAKSPAIQRDES